MLAIIKPQVITCIITQNVLKNKANRASLKVKMGTSGRSLSVCPIKCPVALAHIFSRLFMFDVNSPEDSEWVNLQGTGHKHLDYLDLLLLRMLLQVVLDQ